MNLSSIFLHARRKRRAVAGVIAAGAFLLPSCQIPNLRPSELGTSLPTGFNGADNTKAPGPEADGPESSAQVPVEEFFRDPLLTQLIQQALVSNRELKSLEEDVQIARAAVQTRTGAFLPLVGLRGSAGVAKHSAFTPEGAAEKQLTYPDGKRFPQVPGDFLFGLDVLVPLDIWRELRNARAAAVQRYSAAVERRNDFVTRMVADVADNYYRLLALDQRQLTLDATIKIQEQSYTAVKGLFDAGQLTELPVQRFLAEVRKNQSEKLVVRQEIVEVENRLNFLAGRFPQPVERAAVAFLELDIHPLSAGLPVQLLQNRPDIRQAERELTAAGLDIKVARAHFFPRVDISGVVGYQVFNPKYLFQPEAFIANVAGELTAPLVNKAAIKAEYRTANARQLQAVYDYQRTVLAAYTEVVNRFAQAENYRKSLEIKKQQLAALDASVVAATRLFQNARIQYLEVLLASRERLEAQTVVIETKRQQLSAVVNAYQALGGGTSLSLPAELPPRSLHKDKSKP